MRAWPLLLPLLLACAPALPEAELPAEQADGLLRDAILLPLTSRSSSGLLGRVWSRERRRVDASRRVLQGEPHRDETRQHVEVLRRVELLASLGASEAGVGVDASVNERTDVAYSVNVTGYETLDPDARQYLTESGCCVSGRVAQACEGGYVARVLRGSGRLRYLRRIEAGARAGIGPVLHARGGAAYELVDETTFDDAFFALFPEPLDDLCGRLAPEQEIAPIQVVAAENCTVRVYTSDGARRGPPAALYFPDAAACWRASERTCSEAANPVACPATYREADGSVVTRDLLPQNAAAAGGAPSPAPLPAAVAPSKEPDAADPSAPPGQIK